MKECTGIFPHQLFEAHPALEKGRDVFLVEEYLLFRFQKFHAHRLILFRAAMKSYESTLKKKGYTVHYVDTKHASKRKAFLRHILKQGYTVLHVADPVDTFLLEDITSSERCKVVLYDTPQFLLTKEEIEKCFPKKGGWKMSAFYIHMRKKYTILVEGGKPVGGKWSFDTENRKKLPKGATLPADPKPVTTPLVKEARAYVKKHFASSYGDPATFYLPVTHVDAKKWLKAFCTKKLADFGPYQDAMVEEESFVYHSLLSPLLNVGLLTPEEVVDEVQAAYRRKGANLQSIEGFIRQIIGWREYMRAAYQIRGGAMRSKNYFKHKKKLPTSFWKGTTGIGPIDLTIKKVLKTGYAHHIERLMLFGNFMLLCEYDPNEVYAWFMSLFVDAYDWVMVPNVYGMSQFADGGLLVTKPYISSSNYILKMSDFKKGEWSEIWDGLFWRFLKKHRALFAKNQRMSVLTKQLDTKKEEMRAKIVLADQYLKK